MKIEINGTVILQYRDKASNEITHSVYISVEGDDEERAELVATKYLEVVEKLIKEES